MGKRAVSGIIVLCLMTMADGSVASAQTSAGQLRLDTRALRQQRAIEGRSLTQPDAAALDAMNARRDLVRGRAGASSPTERRVERNLDSLSAGRPQTGSLPAGQPLLTPREQLPSSYEDELFLPRNLGSSVVEGLLDRVDDGLADGRLDQARSDLALAEQQLGKLDPTEAAPLQQRATALGLRLRPR